MALQESSKDAEIKGTVIERDDAMQKASVKDFRSLRITDRCKII